jgi:hypothetical protein
MFRRYCVLIRTKPFVLKEGASEDLNNLQGAISLNIKSHVYQIHFKFLV